MIATIFQDQNDMCIRFDLPRNKRNDPACQLDHRFISAPSQRIILALLNQYATERQLTDVSRYFPYYATLAVTFRMPKRLQALIEELDRNQSLFAKTTTKSWALEEALRKLPKNATIEAVRSFLALQKLLAAEKQKHGCEEEK